MGNLTYDAARSARFEHDENGGAVDRRGFGLVSDLDDVWPPPRRGSLA